MSWTRLASAVLNFTESFVLLVFCGTWFHHSALVVVSPAATTPVPSCVQPLGDPAPLQGLAWQSLTALPGCRQVLLVCAALAANCRHFGARLGI